MSDSPFRKANRVERKLKMLVYGKSGLGKTRLALSLPGLAMIDMERGTDWYGDEFPFDVFHTKSVAELTDAVAWLVANGKEQYRTIAIDPITILYEQMQMTHQRVAERRIARRGGDTDDVNLTPRDWGRLKGKWNDLFTSIVNGGFHFVAVAKEKDKRKGEDIIGVKPGAETDAEYWFDTVVRLLDEKGEVMAVVDKDRTGLLQSARMTYDTLRQKVLEIADATQGATGEPEVSQKTTWEPDSDREELDEPEEIKPKKRAQKVKALACPKACGGLMELKKSKDGNEFYGCSNYKSLNCKQTMSPAAYSKAVAALAMELSEPRKPTELWEESDVAWHQEWRSKAIVIGVPEDAVRTLDGASPDELPWEMRAEFLEKMDAMAPAFEQEEDPFANV